MSNRDDLRELNPKYCPGGRAQGLVTRFNSTTGRRYIRYRNYKIPFNAKDVSDYNPEKVTQGQKVLFELEVTHRGVRAKDVMIYVPSKEVYLYLPSPDDVEDDNEPERIKDGDARQESEEDSKRDRNLRVDLIALALFGGDVRLVSLAEDGTYKFLDEKAKLHNLLYVVSSETVQTEMAVKELESMMNDPRVRESEFQTFFERNPHFILNDEYKGGPPALGSKQRGWNAPDSGFPSRAYRSEFLMRSARLETSIG